MKPGSVGFAHTTGAMGRLIRVGEWLKFRAGDDWNHAFLVDEVLPNGDCRIIQATLRGVTDSGLLSEIKGRYILVDNPFDADRTLRFARRQVGTEYGYLTIVAIAIDILSWQWFPAFRGARKQSWTCTALVGESLRFGGWLRDTIDIYTDVPATIYSELVVASANG